MGISNSKLCSLSDIIMSKLKIPKYQRTYAWDKIECEDLWDDLENLINDKREMHFFGQIVVHKDEQNSNDLFIIDGQQRITSSFFLIRAFLNGFNIIQDKYRADDQEFKKLNRKIFVVEELIGLNSAESMHEQKLHLVQNEIDNDFF